MKYVFSYNEEDYLCCSHCGRVGYLTRDHYIPKCYGRDIDYKYIFVPLCPECNIKKANRLVKPSWYKFLNDDGLKILYNYLASIKTSNVVLRRKLDAISKK